MSGRVPFVVMFFLVQLMLIFCHIYASSTYMRCSYGKQKSERKLEQLNERKNELYNKLEELKMLSRVKEVAKARGMVPCRLKNVKRLNDVDTHANNLTA